MITNMSASQKTVTLEQSLFFGLVSLHAKQSPTRKVVHKVHSRNCFTYSQINFILFFRPYALATKLHPVVVVKN